MMRLEDFCRYADQALFRSLMTTKKRERVMQHVHVQLNGVNLSQMESTVKAVTEKPSLAQFQFRIGNQWINGGHNRSTVKGFYGAGQEDTVRTKPFVLDADEPPVLLGEDHGAHPAEYVLHALAACLTTSLVYHAAARGIAIEAVESRLEGEIDLHGFLGLSDQVRTGYQNIRVNFKVKTDASAAAIRELCQFSPVYDIVSNPVPVSISVETN
jgi:uncharacterized OsmC-like protein